MSIRTIPSTFALIFFTWICATFSSASAAPQLVIQGQSGEQLSHIALSDNGRWLATDGIKLFDSSAGLQWGNWPQASGNSPLRFTPDGTRVLTIGPNDPSGMWAPPILLCAVPSGKVLRKFRVDAANVWCDNSRLRSVQDKKLVEYDLRTGKQLTTRTVPDMPKGGRYGPRFAFSENGRYLVEGSAGVIRYWNTTTGRLLGKITDPLRAIGRSAISNDGRRLVTEGDDPKWTPPTDAATESAYARTFRLHVWSTTTKKVTRTFPGYYSLYGGAALLRFSPAGQTLFAAGSDQGNQYNLTTGKEIKFPSLNERSQGRIAAPLGVSSNGLWLGAAITGGRGGDYQSRPVVWGTGAVKPRAVFPARLQSVGKVAWSPDGRYLAGGDKLTLWDAHTGKLLARRPDSYAYDYTWVDANTIRSQTLEKLQWWSVPDLKVRSEFVITRTDPSGTTQNPSSPIDSQYSDGLLVSPDGQTLLTPNTAFGGGLKGELWVWDIKTRKLLRKIRTSKDIWGFVQLGEVLWLPDNKRIVFGTQTKLVLLNLETGTVEHETLNPENPGVAVGAFSSTLRPLALSSDGSWLATWTYQGNKEIVFDMATFTPASAEGIDWWQAQKAQMQVLGPIRTVDTKTATSPDGRLRAVFTNSTVENGLQLWSVAQHKVVLSLFFIGNDDASTPLDWIAVTPSGFYDASPGGETHLRWREGNAFWPVAKSRAKFKRPDLVRNILVGAGK